MLQIPPSDHNFQGFWAKWIYLSSTPCILHVLPITPSFVWSQYQYPVKRKNYSPDSVVFTPSLLLCFWPKNRCIRKYILLWLRNWLPLRGERQKLHMHVKGDVPIQFLALFYTWNLQLLIFLEKPTVEQLLKNFPKLFGIWSFIPWPQKPSTGSYPEPNQSSPYHPILLRSILVLSSHLHLGLLNVWNLERWIRFF
jgi:hypothetical protein